MSMNAVQLPRLQIAKFDGQHHKWPKFWATFLHVVNSQPLAEIEGKALEAVGGFAVAPKNYETVKPTLQQRLRRSEVLLKSLYAELHDAATPTKDLEECVASVGRIRQQLEQLGENINNAQTELCIEKRLSRWALLEAEQVKEADAAWSVRKLRDKLQAIVRIREIMRTATIGKPTHEGRQVQKQAIRTVAAIATPEQQERDKTVLLLSTFVKVRGDAPHTKTIKVPVLFDVGSERSFITKEIVQQLAIEAKHKRPLTVDGLGGTHIT
uniref:Peptidase aspartic putative domain-containing protein n=1 Tax=Parascaris univalens TaxID=6257 RepID=A0A915A3W2_PARUN